MSVEGDLLVWSTVDYVDQSWMPPDVARANGSAMRHVCTEGLKQEAFERRVRIGEIFYSATPVGGVAGAVEYRAWSWIEHADPWGESDE